MSIEVIKNIREKTGLSFADIKKAIDALQTSDEELIIKHLREQGTLKAGKRADRQTNEGGIFSYVHEGRIGVMISLKCETDFVSRSDAFKKLGDDLSLHIVANQPKCVSAEQVDQDYIKSEIDIARTQLVEEGKPEAMIEKILEGKKSKITKDVSLLSQPFLMNTEITVQDLVHQVSQSTGEKIEVDKFVIYVL